MIYVNFREYFYGKVLQRPDDVGLGHAAQCGLPDLEQQHRQSVYWVCCSVGTGGAGSRGQSLFPHQSDFGINIGKTFFFKWPGIALIEIIYHPFLYTDKYIVLHIYIVIAEVGVGCMVIASCASCYYKLVTRVVL